MPDTARVSANSSGSHPATHWLHLFCDISVLFFTIFLSGFLQPILEKETMGSSQPVSAYGEKVGWIYLAAAFAQTAGMWLMRPVIRYELYQKGGGGNGAFIGAIFLLVMHFVIFGFFFVWDGFRYAFGDLSGFKIVIPILFIGLPTLTAIIVSFPGKHPGTLNNRQYWLGWLGTILLTFSIVVASQTCWHLLFDGMGKELHNPSNGLNIFIVLLFGFLFLLFYLPQRYALLITDYRKPGTWIWILAVYAPFAWDVIKGK